MLPVYCIAEPVGTTPVLYYLSCETLISSFPTCRVTQVIGIWERDQLKLSTQSLLVIYPRPPIITLHPRSPYCVLCYIWSMYIASYRLDNFRPVNYHWLAVESQCGYCSIWSPMATDFPKSQLSEVGWHLGKVNVQLISCKWQTGIDRYTSYRCMACDMV